MDIKNGEQCCLENNILSFQGPIFRSRKLSCWRVAWHTRSWESGGANVGDVRIQFHTTSNDNPHDPCIIPWDIFKDCWLGNFSEAVCGLGMLAWKIFHNPSLQGDFQPSTLHRSIGPLFPSHAPPLPAPRRRGPWGRGRAGCWKSTEGKTSRDDGHRADQYKWELWAWMSRWKLVSSFLGSVGYKL